MEWYLYFILVAAGIVAGFINTLAGSGSLLTLPLLMFIGLPPTVANATNRVGILVQSIVSSASFRHQKTFTVRESIWFVIPSVVGSVLGALIAANFNEQLMRTIIGFLLLFMFFMILYKPERWIAADAVNLHKRPKAWVFVVFFLIGVYGGFIQAGVGFFLLAGLVYGAGVNLVKANALKVFITLSFTIFAFIVFAFAGQINYKIGLILASGNAVGAFMGARVAVSWGPRFVRVVLLVVVFVSALELTGALDFLIGIARSL
ncbi:MAG: sulfite exporter TauE/SafE family protein [Bacteroidales bacterium]|nr:sulfite exporter TauE/SafE family protein [Bacteroidales bacterium]